MHISRQDLVRILYGEIFIKNKEIFKDKGWLLRVLSNSTNEDIKILYKATIKDKFIQNNNHILKLSADLYKAKKIENDILRINSDIKYIKQALSNLRSVITKDFSGTIQCLNNALYSLEQDKNNVQLDRSDEEIRNNIDSKKSQIKNIIDNDNGLDRDAKQELIRDLINNRYNGNYTDQAVKTFLDNSIFHNERIELYGDHMQIMKLGELGDCNNHTIAYDGNNGDLIIYTDGFEAKIHIEHDVCLSGNIG